MEILEVSSHHRLALRLHQGRLLEEVLATLQFQMLDKMRKLSTKVLILLSAIWRLAKKIMGYIIILIKGQKMTYFVSKNATFTNQSQFHNLVTQ